MALTKQYSSTKSSRTLKQRMQGKTFKHNVELYIIMLPVLLMIFIFCYIPMYGIIISFQDYTPGAPFLAFDGSVEWVGLKHFINFVQGKYFGRLMSNTMLLSLYGLLFGFWVPIAFGLC